MKQKVNNKKGLSLSIKWAFASSIFIFIILSIFATITYRSALNLIIIEEQQKIKRAIIKVQRCLRKTDSELTNEKIVNLLSVEGLITKNQAKINRFVSIVEQPSITIDIFNTKKKILYTSGKNAVWQKGKKNSPFLPFNKNGLLVTKKLISHKTKKVIGYLQVSNQLSSFYDIRNGLLIALVILEITVLLLSGILGYILSSRFLKPIRILRDTMEIISQDPQKDLQMERIKTKDELEDLSKIFNKMLKRIRSYIKQQEQFVADVSHELRTPVAIIQGQLNMLNRWGKDDPKVLEEALQASLKESKRMKNLIQEMLKLTRAGQLDAHYLKEVTKIKTILIQTINNFSMLYPEFQLNLIDKLKENTKAKIYRNHLEQIIIILLDNAIKYSTNKQQIDIIVKEDNKEVEISICDYGEGIAKDDLDKIFNRFYRVDKARARKKGGNGLGLSIAKQLMENYNGKIAVKSKINQGTEFSISIPKK
ncbi:MAG: HAMP domain-containing histidine kinase [Streptococcaceae bacterium]|jgi:signal transduction histidine kinase|nr:HAMP domain-containing histidine kinase [Streptococcaceae bacterium]